MDCIIMFTFIYTDASGLCELYAKQNIPFFDKIWYMFSRLN